MAICRLEAPSSRGTKRAMSSRLVASSCIWMSVNRPGTRSSNQACSELSHWISSPKAALRGRALRCRGRSGFAFQTPSSIIHSLSVVASTIPGALGSRPKCSASRVGPKSRYSASRARFSAHARTSAGFARLDGRPRSPCATTASPSFSHARRRRRKCRVLTPISSAPRLAATRPSFTWCNTANRSRSRWLNVSISSPGSSPFARTPRTKSERGHFYFNQTGHFYFNATNLGANTLCRRCRRTMLRPSLGWSREAFVSSRSHAVPTPVEWNPSEPSPLHGTS